MNKVKRVCGFEVTLQPERRQFPSEIVPGFIYLGDASDATRADTLRSLGIRRVVNCAGRIWLVSFLCQIVLVYLLCLHSASHFLVYL